MAGHSKWANIKHRKAAQDAKRGKIFTKLIREITVAARIGGSDISSNPRLRDAITKARKASMTADTIDRAVKRGAGGLEGDNMEEICYEGYGPAGVAVLVECLTDNRNRTVAEVRHVFSKSGGNLGTDGSVAYLFTKQGRLSFATGCDEDKIMEIALEAGAEDVIVNDDGSMDVVTSPEAFSAVNDAFTLADIDSETAEIDMVASTETTLDKDNAEKIIRMVDLLEDLDDVQNVYTNADIPDRVLSELE